MSYIYTISTNGTNITITLNRGHHFIEEVSARPETGAHDLVITAAMWRREYGATPELSGPSGLWDALPEVFRQTANELSPPAAVA